LTSGIAGSRRNWHLVRASPLLLFVLSRWDVQIFVLRQDAGRRPTHRDEGVDARPLVLEDLRELA
jgi:hypothetical protein